jgi:dCTP diphosphatase
MVAEREWSQFHTPGNLPNSIVIEPTELLECFQRGDAAPNEGIVEELADVVSYRQLLADRLGLEVHQIVLDELEETKAENPADTARGRSTRYGQLPG